MRSAPYVVGQWVRGKKFYGRASQVEEILHGHRNWIWLLGTRRVGKTSLLKQLEYLTCNGEREYVPIFWDFQGADDPAELNEAFQDSLLDAEERLEQSGIALGDVEGDDLFRSLGRLRRKVRAAGCKLLLLCDEAEQLIRIHERDPSFLSKLRRNLQSHEGIRSVLASTIRLWALSDVKGDTSPFLHGFAPPLYIAPLTDDEARALIRQDNLDAEVRPAIDERAVETIRSRCDNHPYLIQLVGKRFVEDQDLDEAIDHVSSDPMVGYFFSVDFEMLGEAEKTVIRTVSTSSGANSKSLQTHVGLDESELGSVLQSLEQLGYVRRNAERRFELINFFFRRWLQQQPLPGSAEPVSSTGVGLTSTAKTLAGKRMTSAGDAPFAGRYHLVREVGEGATGMVYQARDTVLGETIALKVLKPAFSNHPEILARFRQEILLSRDLGHPNIVKTYHLGDHEGRWYLTMQWIDGQTLADRLTRGPLSIDQAIGVSVKLASALGAAHRKRVIHRDIKTQNILLDGAEEPFLSDFGLSRLQDAPGMTRSGVFVGTPDFASPEQAALRPVDARSDIYSLGVVMYVMFTGRKLFDADSISKVLRMHEREAPVDPRNIRAQVPTRCARIILRCLEKDPNRRYPDAERLTTELRACVTA